MENPAKTDNGRLISSYQCDSRIADAEFAFSKRQYFNRTGRRRGRDNVIAYTIRQSFVPGEITPEEANRLGYELAMRFTKGNHAFIVCTHVDKAHIHNHIIWNSTTLDCTKTALDNDTSQSTRKSMGMDGRQAWYVRNKKRRSPPRFGWERRFMR